MRISRHPLLMTAALAASVLVAVAAIAGVGTAASQAVPRNTTPPTVSGTPAQGSTLTAENGEWAGTAPLQFSYSWRRCDENGGSCSAISGATQKTYTVKPVDSGNTLRVRVTAQNAEGSSTATSVPTAVIRAAPTPAPTGCPSGSGMIQAEQLAPPARLVITAQALSPSVVGASTTGLTARFRVSACDGRPVQGALIYVTAVPYNQFSVPSEQATDGEGWATLSLQRLEGFPAARRQQLLVMFVRARKANENVLGGISTRRLVSFRVNLAS
jgi:predicted actin-binding protein